MAQARPPKKIIYGAVLDVFQRMAKVRLCGIHSLEMWEVVQK